MRLKCAQQRGATTYIVQDSFDKSPWGSIYICNPSYWGGGGVSVILVQNKSPAVVCGDKLLFVGTDILSMGTDLLSMVIDFLFTLSFDRFSSRQVTKSQGTAKHQLGIRANGRARSQIMNTQTNATSRTACCYEKRDKE